MLFNIFAPLFENNKLNNLLQRFFVFLNNFSYQAIAKLAVIENGGLHPKHKILNYHQFFVNRIEEEDVVLDIGCGNGANTFDIAGKAKRVIGIDIHRGNLKYAVEHYHRDNLEFVLGDITDFDFSGLGIERFDKIVLSNVLEHIDDRVGLLSKLSRWSSIILLRVPMITRDWLPVYEKKRGFEYRLDKTHYIEYTMGGLRDEITTAGWKITEYSIEFGEFLGVLKNVRRKDQNFI